MKSNIALRTGYLHVQITGYFEISLFKKLSSGFLEVAHGHGTNRIIIDILPLQGEPTFAERIEYSKFMVGEINKFLVLDSTIFQLAYLATQPIADPDKIGEIFGKNRGATVYLNPDINKCLAWLGIEE